MGDSIAWLKELFGNFGDGELTAPCFGRRVDGDNEPFCSVDCTMGLLMRNPQAQEILAPIMAAAQEKWQKSTRMSWKAWTPVLIRTWG